MKHWGPETQRGVTFSYFIGEWWALVIDVNHRYAQVSLLKDG